MSSVYSIFYSFIPLLLLFSAVSPIIISHYSYLSRGVERVLEGVPTGLDAKDLLISLSSRSGILATLLTIDPLSEYIVFLVSYWGGVSENRETEK